VVVGAANDPSALGATRAFQEAGRAGTCAIVGHNAEPDARAELREPRTPFVASVAFFPERYGDGLVKLAFDILGHRPVPPALFIHHQLVTTANVNHLYPNDALLAGTRAVGEQVSGPLFGRSAEQNGPARADGSVKFGSAEALLRKGSGFNL